MANIKIPNIHLPGIKLISEISDEKIQTIYDVLKKQVNGIGINKFISIFNDTLKDETLEPIAGAIFSFGQLLSYNDLDFKDIAHNLTESYQELANDKLSPEQSSLLEDRLNTILSNSTFLIVTNEAYNLFSDLNSTLRTKVSTDVRLLFNNSDYENRNAVLLHKMMIRFSHKGETDTQIFYLDNDDLIELKSQIEQSLLDEENIRKNNEGVLNFLEIS